jgi:FkbM family methyltransferase
MSQVLRKLAVRTSSLLYRQPRLHAALKGIFLKLPESVRGRQMIHDRLEEFGRSNHQDVTFCVVGANDGVTNDHLYSFAKRHRWKGILVEPVPPYFAELKKAYEGLPVVLENVAIHRTETKMTIHYLDAAKANLPAWAKGVGSFDKTKLDTLSELPQRGDALSAVEVDCFPLETVVKRSGFDRIDVFVVDVEGYDAEIVRQIDFDGWKVRVLIFEHKLLSKEDMADCLALLDAHGFQRVQDRYDVIAVRESVPVATP